MFQKYYHAVRMILRFIRLHIFLNIINVLIGTYFMFALAQTDSISVAAYDSCK
jgi:hypothetical protein